MAFVLDLQGLPAPGTRYCTHPTVTSTQTAFRPE
jgi:hypothetical protein